MSTPRHEVLLTAGAERDLHELHDYIARFDSAAAADALLDKLGDVIEKLALFPERGAFPKELIALGIREYRQVMFKPYRLIYRVRDRKIYVYLIVDGRRDMQALLARRLLGA